MVVDQTQSEKIAQLEGEAIVIVKTRVTMLCYELFYVC